MVFAGGGTGGHLYPALALCEALQGLRPDITPHFVGARRGIEARVLPQRGFEPLLLDIEGLSRASPLRNVGVVRKLVRAVHVTLAHYRRWRPRLVVVTGGYAAAPAGLAAVFLRIPLALQEQNSWPGVTTRMLARWARQIHVAYPECIPFLSARARPRVQVSGNPIRALREESAAQARAALGLPDRPTLLVAGGSQGSRALNERVLDAVRGVEGEAWPRPEALQLLWSTGPTHEEPVRAALRQLGDPEWVHVVPYIDDMPRALNAADLALSRAGAMTTSEYLAAGLPSILLPLPTAAEDHQTRNAEALAAADVAVHLPERSTDGRGLWSAVCALLHDPSKLRRMSENARARGRPQAAQAIARALSELLPEGDE